MLTAHHISKSYGIQPVLNDISFSLSSGKRSGLIGPNGCGKTTLLRILTGQAKPDSGSVAFTRPNLRIGYLAQGLETTSGQTVAAFLNLAADQQGDIEVEIARLATALAKNPLDLNLQSRYDLALERLANPGVKPEVILAPLGLLGFPSDTPIRQLSGGQKTRLSLARILLADPHLLLLDEPTNHLDICMLEWLEDWLNGFKGAALVVSHDRTFLDNTVSNMLELDAASHGMKAYPGNYSDYIEHKLAEREHQAQDWQDQQAEIAQLKAAAAHLRGLTKFKKGGRPTQVTSLLKTFSWAALPRAWPGAPNTSKTASRNCLTSKKWSAQNHPGR
jgi:ATPase subunit of ABC transporter with duplicated ATPase domains